MITLTIEQCEQAIGIPAERWKGRCYEISCKIVEAGIVTGRAVYGHYLGEVAKDGYFGHRSDLPFQGHGWILAAGHTLIDPTRWVFENVEPYLYIADEDDDVVIDTYDEGGNLWREANMIDPPPADADGEIVDVAELAETYAFDHVKQLLNDVDYITTEHVFWLANLPPRILGDMFIIDIYVWIIGLGHGAFIPLDNRLKYLGAEPCQA